MPRHVKEFVESMFERMWRGDMSVVRDSFRYPLSTFYDDTILIHATPEELELQTLERRDLLLDMGVTNLRLIVGDIGQVRNGRFDVTYVLIFLDQGGREVTRNRATLLCRIDDRSGIRIESMKAETYGIPLALPRRAQSRFH